MSNTHEFAELKAGAAKLEANLLNFAARSDGAYTDEELLKCQAFIAFTHAEIQVYLEKVARRVLSEALDAWKNHGIFGRVLVTLLAYRHKGDVAVPGDPKQPHASGTLQSIIEAAAANQNEAISNNNGVKRFNVSELFTPLGVLETDIEEVLLIELDQIGKRRGVLVHKASSVSVRTIRDPKTDEQPQMAALIGEVQNFDTALIALGLITP